MKKIISLVLSVVMMITVLATVGFTAQAAQTDAEISGYGDTSGTFGSLSWNYDKNTKTLSVTGNGPMFDLTSYSQQPWSGWSYDTNVINIGSGITTIGAYCFEYFDSEINFNGANITSIGDYAFHSNAKITSFQIPKTVKYVGKDAFSSCKNLVTLTGEAAVKLGAYAFSYSDSLQTVSLPNAVEFGEYCFSGCDNLITVTAPKAKCCKSVLYSADNIKNVTVGTLENDALKYLTSLTTLNIKNASKIGDYALYGCTGIKSITSNAKSVGEYAFYECTSLTSINLPKVTTVKKYAFRNTPITTAKFGKIQSVGTYAFANCYNLKTVTGTGNLKKVENAAFGECQKLTKISTGSKLTYIGDDAFFDCKVMTGSFNAANYKYVGSSAFYNCPKLTSTFTFKKVKEIGSSAFANCKNIKCNTLGTKITKLGSKAFLGCGKITKIYIPSSCKSVGYDSFVSKVNSVSTSGSYIKMNYYSKNVKAVIYGNKNSEAQTYARIYKHKFRYAVKKITLKQGKKTVNSKTVKLKKGKKFTLKISVSPSNAATKSVTLKTSNKKVATISSKGTVKATGKGKCTITVASKDGSQKTAKITVKVS